MSRTTMYDAIDVGNIPKDANYVAGYVGGHWPTYSTLERDWPHAKHVLSIAVASSQDAECVDRETGDVPANLVPGWVRRQKARGVHRPVVYASISAMPEMLLELKKAGIERGEVLLWSAHYTHNEHICGPHSCGWPTQADATQWTDRAHGKSLDQSLMEEGFWGELEGHAHPASRRWPPHTLKYGSEGPHVRRLQRLLNVVRNPSKVARQPVLKVDGFFGKATEKRVNQFKRHHGLRPLDGKVASRMGKRLIQAAKEKS